MDIIPVIDLMDGCVVHAKRGERRLYQPLRSMLCHGSEPLTVVAALLELYPFRHLYIADINAIQARESHGPVIRQIRNRYPDIEIWLDAGINDVAQARIWKSEGMQCIIASESCPEIDSYLGLHDALGKDAILSLDFHHHGHLGPQTLLKNQSLWPERVIGMSLSRVGSNEGPDIDLLSGLQASQAKVYAAGGVRDAQDLNLLANRKIAGALVASMLHSGKISAAQMGGISPGKI